MAAQSQTPTPSRRATSKRGPRLNPALVAISEQADALADLAYGLSERITMSDWSPGWLEPVAELYIQARMLLEAVTDLDERAVPTGLSPQHAEDGCEWLAKAVSLIHAANRLAPTGDLFAAPRSFHLHAFLWVVKEIRSALFFAMLEFDHLSRESRTWASWEWKPSPRVIKRLGA